jgi:hypothetical protein
VKTVIRQPIQSTTQAHPNHRDRSAWADHRRGSGTYPASAANDGFVLVYGGGDTWLLRDYRKHRSTPVPVHLDTTYGLGDIEAAWLRNSLVITMRSGEQPLLLVDPARPTAEPTSTASPCTSHDLKRELLAVAGAVIVQCEGRGTRVVGLAAR